MTCSSGKRVLTFAENFHTPSGHPSRQPITHGKNLQNSRHDNAFGS